MQASSVKQDIPLEKKSFPQKLPFSLENQILGLHPVLQWRNRILTLLNKCCDIQFLPYPGLKEKVYNR